MTSITPVRLDAMRAGAIDTRGLDLTAALLIEGDTVASVSSVTVARRDNVTIGANDLTITPAGKASPWASGVTANWWQTSGASIAAAGAVDYLLKITVVTTAGRTLPIDAYQLVSPLIG